MVLFARGVIALLDGWDILRLAIAEGWGGPESSAKRTWLASTIVDEFESSTASNSPDLDYVSDLILQAMSDEFDVDIDDGSTDRIAESMVKLWAAEPAVAAQMVTQFQAAAERKSKVKVQASRGEGNGDSDWESDSEDEDGVPRLIESGAQSVVPREKPEPVVDEDGFTLVQGKGKGKH
jgi:pre-rRNA-processing protein TSR2